MMIRTYSELIFFPSFLERFEYLRLGGRVGVQTFGFDRIFHQRFLHSLEWRNFRNYILERDHGYDLGARDREIPDGMRIIIHHMNPITTDDLERRPEILMDPETTISTTHDTHNAIHYGDDSLLMKDPIVRTPFDTCPWKR